MPRGERQTTGTAQALLGAKQIAAGERASERQESIAKKGIIADYIKTGIGTLKSVGDYLQKKQALEQNQDKLNLEQSMFSAQYGDEGEQGRKRKQEEELRLANTAVAQGTIDARIKAAEAGARKLAGEAAQSTAAGDVAPETEAQKLAEGKLRIEGMTIDNKVADIRSGFAEGFAQGELDLVRTKKDGLLQEIEASKARTTDAEVGRELEAKRLEIEKNYREALMGEMVNKGILSEKQFDLEKEKWEKTSDPEKREAMLSAYDKQLREAQLEKTQQETKSLRQASETEEARQALYLKAGGKEPYLDSVQKGIDAAEGAKSIGGRAGAFKTGTFGADQARADLKAGKKASHAIQVMEAINRLDVQSGGASGRGIPMESHSVAMLEEGVKDDEMLSDIHGRRTVEYFAKLMRDAPNELPFFVQNYAEKWTGGRAGMLKAFEDLSLRQTNMIARGGAAGSVVWDAAKKLTPLGLARSAYEAYYDESSLDASGAGMTVIQGVLGLIKDPNSTTTMVGPKGLQLLKLTTVGGD